MHDLNRLLRVIEREGLLRLSRMGALLHGTLELLHALSIYKGTRERDRGAIVRVRCTNKDGKTVTLERNYEAFQNAVRVCVIPSGLSTVARDGWMMYVQRF